VKRFIPFLLAFVLPLLLIYAWWGGFNRVLIEETVRGPYVYAYKSHTGDFAKLPDVQVEVRQALVSKGIEPGLPITVLLTNPDVVPMGERVGRAGYLVPAGTEVAAPLLIDQIPPRKVWLAQVRAGILLAPSKAYLALDRHLQAQGRGIAMPTVEIYEPTDSPWHMGRLSVEVSQP